MGTVTLRVQSTECSLPIEDVTIERIMAEARAVGLAEFAVTLNGVDIQSPDDLDIRDGDLIVILPANYQDAEITVDIANDDGSETVNVTAEIPDDAQ